MNPQAPIVGGAVPEATTARTRRRGASQEECWSLVSRGRNRWCFYRFYRWSLVSIGRNRECFYLRCLPWDFRVPTLRRSGAPRWGIGITRSQHSYASLVKCKLPLCTNAAENSSPGRVAEQKAHIEPSCLLKMIHPVLLDDSLPESGFDRSDEHSQTSENQRS